jgi:hypothetical protein
MYENSKESSIEAALSWRKCRLASKAEESWQRKWQ